MSPAAPGRFALGVAVVLLLGGCRENWPQPPTWQQLGTLPGYGGIYTFCHEGHRVYATSRALAVVPNGCR